MARKPRPEPPSRRTPPADEATEVAIRGGHGALPVDDETNFIGVGRRSELDEDLLKIDPRALARRLARSRKATTPSPDRALPEEDQPTTRSFRAVERATPAPKSRRGHPSPPTDARRASPAARRRSGAERRPSATNETTAPRRPPPSLKDGGQDEDVSTARTSPRRRLIHRSGKGTRSARPAPQRTHAPKRRSPSRSTPIPPPTDDTPAPKLARDTEERAAPERPGAPISAPAPERPAEVDPVELAKRLAEEAMERAGIRTPVGSPERPAPPERSAATPSAPERSPAPSASERSAPRKPRLAERAPPPQVPIPPEAAIAKWSARPAPPRSERPSHDLPAPATPLAAATTELLTLLPDAVIRDERTITRLDVFRALWEAHRARALQEGDLATVASACRLLREAERGRPLAALEIHAAKQRWAAFLSSDGELLAIFPQPEIYLAGI